MIQLFREARAVQDTLDGQGWRFCFIGGLAVQHWGEPRATRDLDISLFAGFGQEAGIVDRLLALYPPRRPDARDFALRHRVLLLATPTGIPIDLALAGLAFESEMIDRAVEVEFLPSVRLRICSAEDLVVLKAFADRPQDQADLLGIARRRGRTLDWVAVLARLGPLAEAKEDLEILQTMRALHEQFGRQTSG